MSSTRRIALAQVNSTADPDENLGIIENHTAAAVADGASIVVFPEAMMRRFGEPLAEVAQPVTGPWANAVRRIAERHGVTLVAGMFTPTDSGRVRNTVIVVGPGVDAHYDKIHLYDAFGFAESDTVAPGTEPLVVDIGGLMLGVATCYDIRFPALFQTLADRGAQLISVSASWGAGPGKVDQWQLLARARALDSTTFVAACGQADPAADGGPASGSAPTGVGHSLVVGPNGVVHGALGAASELLIVDIDLDELGAVRASLPVLANRRSFPSDAEVLTSERA
ncbi:carbon-nitrogen hydrolase family protein [Millisia brevis]|uniref:carbon-nitrogen hydrolase family protein n=1 Tax=Millisia brevis TaxID=264148 RepID=UPI00082D0EA3|nr:carbon-nitrogen hydrolase family protein [Millisia brevis]